MNQLPIVSGELPVLKEGQFVKDTKTTVVVTCPMATKATMAKWSIKGFETEPESGSVKPKMVKTGVDKDGNPVRLATYTFETTPEEDGNGLLEIEFDGKKFEWEIISYDEAPVDAAATVVESEEFEIVKRMLVRSREDSRLFVIERDAALARVDERQIRVTELETRATELGKKLDTARGVADEATSSSSLKNWLIGLLLAILVCVAVAWAFWPTEPEPVLATTPVATVGILGTQYSDADGDGFGDPTVALTMKPAMPGFVGNYTDCDDSNATVHPGAPEYVDGLDNDCDGTVDGPGAVTVTVTGNRH